MPMHAHDTGSAWVQALTNQQAVVRFLVEKKHLDVNVRAEVTGVTPLLLVATRRCAYNGGPVTGPLQHSCGLTSKPQHMGPCAPLRDMAALLIELGADLAARDACGACLLAVAASAGTEGLWDHLNPATAYGKFASEQDCILPGPPLQAVPAHAGQILFGVVAGHLAPPQPGVLQAGRRGCRSSGCASSTPMPAGRRPGRREVNEPLQRRTAAHHRTQSKPEIFFITNALMHALSSTHWPRGRDAARRLLENGCTLDSLLLGQERFCISLPTCMRLEAYRVLYEHAKARPGGVLAAGRVLMGALTGSMHSAGAANSGACAEDHRGRFQVPAGGRRGLSRQALVAAANGPRSLTAVESGRCCHRYFAHAAVSPWWHCAACAGCWTRCRTGAPACTRPSATGPRPLVMAAEFGLGEHCAELLQRGASATQRDARGVNAFWAAAKHRDEAVQSSMVAALARYTCQPVGTEAKAALARGAAAAGAWQPEPVAGVCAQQGGDCCWRTSKAVPSSSTCRTRALNQRFAWPARCAPGCWLFMGSRGHALLLTQQEASSQGGPSPAPRRPAQHRQTTSGPVCAPCAERRCRRGEPADQRAPERARAARGAVRAQQAARPDGAGLRRGLGLPGHREAFGRHLQVHAPWHAWAKPAGWAWLVLGWHGGRAVRKMAACHHGKSAGESPARASNTPRYQNAETMQGLWGQWLDVPLPDQARGPGACAAAGAARAAQPLPRAAVCRAGARLRRHAGLAARAGGCSSRPPSPSSTWPWCDTLAAFNIAAPCCVSSVLIDHVTREGCDRLSTVEAQLCMRMLDDQAEASGGDDEPMSPDSTGPSGSGAPGARAGAAPGGGHGEPEPGDVRGQHGRRG